MFLKRSITRSSLNTLGLVPRFVRSAGLVENKSRYLIRRIEETPTIVIWPQTEIVGLEGGDHLESVQWRNGQTEQMSEHKIRHVFVMTGAAPNTSWRYDCVALDAKGFIKTGSDLSPENLSAARWPLARQPYSLETSLPGVFAVGEGSIAISFIHKALGIGNCTNMARDYDNYDFCSFTVSQEHTINFKHSGL